MDEIEQIMKRLDLIVQALDTLRAMTELNEQRITNLENKVFEVPDPASGRIPPKACF